MGMSLQMGLVELYVQNLLSMKHFYHGVMELDVIQENSEELTLGIKGNPLIKLYEKKGLRFAKQGEAGLYHFAIVFSSRGDLSRMIHRILKHAPKHFSGSGDHIVSEAFYFYDPEGNGIELYYDRDKTTWKWQNGQIQMATLYIDPKEYLEKYLVLEEKSSKVAMGHIHLKVGDIEKAKQFYVNILGFSITAELPSALFISVDKYHHHLGLNTWESFGAKERSRSTGLKSFELKIDVEAEIDIIKEKLNSNNIPFKEKNKSISFSDPWKNTIIISSH